MAYARTISNSEAAEIVLAHIRGDSNRIIGKRHGRAHTTISRLLAAPDIAAIVAEERAKIVAVEQAQADVLREARRRETSRKSSATHRKKQAKKQLAADRAVSLGKTTADGRILGAYVSGRKGSPGLPDDDGWLVMAGAPSELMSRAAWFAAEREVDPATIRCAANTHIGQYGYLVMDEAELRAAARNVAQDRPDLDIRDILTTLASQPEGARFTFPAPLEDLPLAKSRTSEVPEHSDLPLEIA